MINLALNIAAFLFLAWVAVMVLAGIVFIVISPFVAISEAMHQGRMRKSEKLNREIAASFPTWKERMAENKARSDHHQLLFRARYIVWLHSLDLNWETYPGGNRQNAWLQGLLDRELIFATAERDSADPRNP